MSALLLISSISVGGLGVIEIVQGLIGFLK